MRLYLSSYRLGNDPQSLVDLASGATKAIVICNAADNAPTDYRRKIVERELADMHSLGFSAVELDLRNWFRDEEDISNALNGVEVVWVSGGNAFLLRRAMRQSGLDEVLPSLVRANEVVYAGYSAGPVVITPTLRGVEIVDKPDDIAPGYLPEVIIEGLGFVDFCFAPHFRSDHPESSAVEKMVEFFEEQGMPYRAVSDGEAIVIND